MVFETRHHVRTKDTAVYCCGCRTLSGLNLSLIISRWEAWRRQAGLAVCERAVRCLRRLGAAAAGADPAGAREDTHHHRLPVRPADRPVSRPSRQTHRQNQGLQGHQGQSGRVSRCVLLMSRCSDINPCPCFYHWRIKVTLYMVHRFAGVFWIFDVHFASSMTSLKPL